MKGVLMVGKMAELMVDQLAVWLAVSMVAQLVVLRVDPMAGRLVE
jgi:hypothetical protein